MVKCPECGEEYKSLGNHWSWNLSHRPELTQKQLEVTKGLLMGDGSINNSGKNYRLETIMVSQNYLKYLDNVFGCLGTGVSLYKTAAKNAKENRNSGFSSSAKEQNYSDLYQWRTRKHPRFNQFYDWYSSGEKVWPKDIELTQTVLKHWYVGDGDYDNSGKNDYMRITMSNETENIGKVSQYFTNAGLPKPSNYSIRENDYTGYCRAKWTVEDSYELWDYMGEPLPDFEYKWPEEYR